MSTIITVLVIFGFVVRFLLKNTTVKPDEEMEKTTLPGRHSGEPLRQPLREKAAPSPTPSPEKQPVNYRLHVPQEAESAPLLEAVKEEEVAPVLNINDAEELKKAIIYSEIFNSRKF